MATYKVIQDIEAEDHILGPLSLRQFIYGLIAALFIYLCVVCITHHVAFLVALFLPPALFTGFLAFPFGRDQPTEVWALAKLRFLVKPRRRIWDQSGVKELVTVTAPKKIEAPRTNGLDQVEVKSRLHALADTIDSRGWAIKNVNVNLYSQPGQLTLEDSDRLINVDTMPQEVPDYDVQASDDMLDEQSNPVAQQMEQMINASTQAHRQHIMSELQAVRTTGNPTPPPTSAALATPPADYWFLQQTATHANPVQTQIVHPGISDDPTLPVEPTPEEQSLIKSLKASSDAQHISYPHLHTIQPLDDNQNPQVMPPTDNASPAPVPTPLPSVAAATPTVPVPPAPQAPAAPVTASPDPAILSLANNNDFDVATIAREAHKATSPEEPSQDEVVISLH